MRRSRIGLCLAIPALIAIAAATPANTASAEPGTDTSSSTSPFDDSTDTTTAAAHQQDLALNDVADDLGRFASDPHFANLSIDRAANTVTVLWKGKPSSALSAALGKRSNGVTVQATPTTYSNADLQGQITRLLKAAPAAHLAVAGAGPDDNYAGLRVLTDSTTPVTSLAARSTVQSSLQSLVSVPITSVAPGGDIINRTRRDDSDPWQGAGELVIPSRGSVCTVGFAVVTSSGAGRLLSAGHCAPGGDARLEDGHGDTLSNGGSAVSVAPDYDSLLIDPVGGTIGKVFGGVWNAPTTGGRYQFKVAGSGVPATGSPICVSGAMTGEHCNAVIANTGFQFRCFGSGSHYCPGFEARSDNGHIIDGAGDSGSPVYVERSDGRVGARGILVAGVPGYQTSCPSDTWYPLSYGDCDTRAYVVGITHLADLWKVTVDSLS
jgi:hypothetical protein